MTEDRLFARIAPLFDVGSMSQANVLIAGCGSGGSQVALQLAMSGIHNFDLNDSDILEPENVIRHACGLRYIGQKKTAALSDVLLDRNPKLNIYCHDTDLMNDAGLEDRIGNSTVVVLATDNEPTRYRINQICVDKQVPFVVGRVFTRGIGGEVFSYLPREGGCLACLERVLERSQFRDGIREIDLVSEEVREQMYGLEISEIKDSPGLNVDISFITCFHTRYVLDAIARSLPTRPKHLPNLGNNYLVWGNRPVPPFQKNFEIQRINLQQQESCLICSKGAEL